MSKFVALRTEEEVGILCRLSSHPRFKAIFKSRFSDFHVNEIDPTGKIVQLTDLAPPPEEKSEVPEDDSQIYSWIPEDVRNTIVDLNQKLEFALGEKFEKSNPLWKETVKIKVSSLGKEERTKIHKWLGNYHKLNSETVDKDGEKFIVVLFDNKNRRGRRRPATRPKYTHFTLYKEGVETSEAVALISKRLRIKPNLITYSGTKDRHGKTTQRMCISNMDASRLVPISKEVRPIKLGNYEYLPYHLRLGDLKGNHFKILLRDVRALSEELISSPIKALESGGFINYFGLQRFGSYEHPTHAVGKKILQNNWLEAFDMILSPKDNDREFMKEAKSLWFTNRDPVAAIEKLPHSHRSIESNLLHGLARYYSKNDFVGVFLRLPRNVRHLYIHAFQSFLWNQVASYRIQKLGTHPVVGDVVYEDKNQEDFFVEEIDPDSEDESPANEIIDISQSQSQTQTVSSSSSSGRSSSTIRVKVLTKDDLPNYSIFDVLIPIQGTEIKMPDTPIKQFYDDLLKEQGIDPDFFLKFRPIADQPKGAYRKFLIRPQNLSSKIISYNDSDPVDSFIPSEIDRLNKKPRDDEKDTNGTTTTITKDDADDSAIKKDKKCVIVEFSLPASSYATMALREITYSGDEVTTPKKRSKVSNEVEDSSDEPESKSSRRCDGEGDDDDK